MTIYSYLERLRSEIENVKKTILDPRVVKSLEDYHSRIGYLTGLQKALELFAQSNNSLTNED